MGFYKRAAAIVIVFTCYCLYGYSQGTTSMGTEFWTAYMANTNPPGTSGGSQMDLYITSNVNTSGTVTFSDGNTPIPFTVTANNVTVLTMPASTYISSQGTFNEGIHITSLQPIAIYAHIFAQESSGATLLLPVNAMGKDYYSINYTQNANETAYSTFMIIATEDNTTVEITPSVKLLDGTAANAPFTITLKKGQVYQGLAGKDLSGTRIRSISSGSGPCTKIAVFSGSSRIEIGCNAAQITSDNLFQQVYPTASWGENYITVPLAGRSYDVFRIALSNPATNVQVNGKAVASSSFVNGFYYEFNATTPQVITADQPIQVVQYAVSQYNTESCGTDENDIGDPEMIYLTPIEQTVNNVTLFSTSNYKILNSYINVTIKTSDVASFMFDGKNYSSSFGIVPGDQAYSYAQLSAASGTHTLIAANGFNAIAYGFGVAESYGYAAGANLQDLNTNIALQNPQNNTLQTNGCTDVNYNLELTVPYKITSITWDLQDGSTPYQQNNPVIASTTQNGSQIIYHYLYSKGPISFKSGDHTIIATVFDPSTDECGSTQQIQLDFKITDPPVAKFDVDNTQLDYATTFIDQSTSTATIKSWAWDFGDGQTSYVENPTNLYAKPGTYTVTLTVTDVNGCTSVYQKTIFVPIVATVVSGSIGACAGMASASPNIQQFAVSGAGLSAGIVATAPANFEISLSPNTGYSNSLTINQTGGAVNNIVVYVRSAATAPVGNIAGDVTLTSTGVTGQKVAVTGIINELPTVNAVAPQTVESGALTSPVIFTGTSNSYTWVNNTPDIGLPASGVGNISAFTAVNNTKIPVVATLKVTPVSLTIAYIANASANNISVINTVTNDVVASIPVGGYPQGVSASPDGSKIYVSNYYDSDVSVISTYTNTVIATIPVGPDPFGLASSPDGSRLYVTNTSSDNIVVVNTATNKIEASITVGARPVGLAINADGSRVYVTNSDPTASSVSVINTASNLVIATIPISTSPGGLILSPDGSTLYVTNTGSNSLSIINTATNSIISTIPVGAYPFGISITPDGSKLYITDSQANTVSVVSTATDKVITTIPVGTDPYGVDVSPDGNQVYVTNRGTNTVSVINTANNTVAKVLQTDKGPSSFGKFIVAGTGCTGPPATFTITVDPSNIVITVNGILPPLSTNYGIPSSSGSFTVSGDNLKEGILVTPPQGFEVSTDDIHFSNTVTVGGAGSVISTTVYVRLAATTPVNTYSGNVVLSSTGAGSANVLAAGTVLPAPLTIKADNKARTFEAANPPLTATFTGFVNNETAAKLTIQPLITTTANITSPIGEYPITASGAESPNYTISYLPGILNVVAAGLIIPNTFTPNGDGINDTWNIKYIENYPNCTVDIFNRYGTKLFTSIGYPIPWNGKYNGANLPVGTYYYIINPGNGQNTVSGYVAIIR
ncbi:gliding motility-associated C-terminal domain-containing protein [Mucilaginibacter sp. X5P1]|uniref:T9SS type B sorting domain-containing protein n=1 Tax=Mucilaginibacter sp. X5P1 TaxID=2723088 RepID=UPI001610EA23|nr:gliding motility-associated-like protein [Mucilaginibacter sp. X5P1]